ncbi:MAG: tRNA pseudouridine(38-40) synthase TruA [Phycisphaerales bacterium]|nr:tRNA pseudouridine(38-40) synthase TruA [Phycisphaerales bacterium]
MPRVKLTVAYDGTEFHGWQRQEPPDAPALRTVQGVLQDVVATFVRDRVVLMGASRTDSGVHAIGQVAAFTAEHFRVPVERIPIALNARLPRDVQVLDASFVAHNFNPIGDAKSKCYRYVIEHLGPPHNPAPLFDRDFVFNTPHELSLERMRQAASQLVGTHDFEAFAQISHGRENTVRTIYACNVRMLAERRFAIEVSGSGFLYNMVRILAGTLLDVGRGKIDANSIGAIIASKDRRQAGTTLPPHGLCLRWIHYGVPKEDGIEDVKEDVIA